MKQTEPVRHLNLHGCVVLREGANHTVYVNEAGNRAAVPRHSEVNTLTAWDICKALKIPRPKGR